MLFWGLQRQFFKVAPPMVEIHESQHSSWKWMVDRDGCSEQEVLEHMAELYNLHNDVAAQIERIKLGKNERALDILNRIKFMIYDSHRYIGNDLPFDEYVAKWLTKRTENAPT